MAASGKRWKSTVCYDGRHHSLGVFNTKEEAAVAYDKEARQHKGPNVPCNFDNAEEGDAAASLASCAWEREH